ncbi:helix-turn-helix domain-containing protein [Streptomyces polygonati]|uniref:Helix-turn-helix domain-containing protein n=1 Tax=Streptomyces polygonati TaxID=1617087 RepID=A0ABV8HIP6_9ACTN
MRNDLLLALRNQRGWTQEELSERSGISVRTIRNLERGRVQSPRRSSLDLLFSVLDPERRGNSAGGPIPGGGGAFHPGGNGPGNGAGNSTGNGIGNGAANAAGNSGLHGAGNGHGSGSGNGAVRVQQSGDQGRARGPASPAPGAPVGVRRLGPAAAAGRPSRWRGPRPPRTSLVGRDSDLDRLCDIVTGHPVTVITGPGGIGKSRLALAVAERTAAEFPGGIAVAQLGRIAVTGAVGGAAGNGAVGHGTVGDGGGGAVGHGTVGDGGGGSGPVAHGIGGPGPGIRDPGVHGVPGGDGPGALAAAGHSVAELLGDERQPPGTGPALLVLDTAEHLPQTTALLVEQLRGAWPDARIVVTTRRPPALAEARIWETRPLPLDSAVELMSRRLASNSLTDDLAGSPARVRELCRELDCVPRLIEFAAYWLRSVPVSALLRPDQVLELLGVPDVSALPHQRSMRGSLEWSWGMLTARQRQFMLRLAERPEPVASDGLESASLEPEFSGTEAVCLLAELADASLLQVSRGARYEYRMLRHVRAFVRHRAEPVSGAPRPAAVCAAACG